MNNKKLRFVMIVLVLLMAVCAVLTYTFLLAYSSPAKAVTIHINNSGEAISELFLLPVIFVLGLVAIVIVVKAMRHNNMR